MNLIPHSNGINKVKIKKKIPITSILKWIIYSLIIIILTGIVFQFLVGKVYNEKYKPRTKYTRIDDNRIYFNSIGSGDMTIIFDGDLGLDFNEWNNIARDVSDKLDVRTFVYNRRGYGFSDGGERIEPQKQADDLKLLLNKAGIPGPYVLVGSGYGSLVMTNFANTYADYVKAMVLINPLVEENLKDTEYISEYNKIKKDSKFEVTASYFGVSFIKNKLGLLKLPDGLFSDSQEELKNEFLSNRIRSKYPSAMHNEALNILEEKSNSQKSTIIPDAPLAIVSKDSKVDIDKALLNLSNSKYINHFVSEKEGDIIPLSDKDKVIESIKYVVDKSRLKK